MSNNENEKEKVESFPFGRSNTSPLEDYIDIIDGDEDILNSYNYYMYYHAQKPLNPRLKKPKYKPTPNYDFIRSGLPEISSKPNDDSLSLSKDPKDAKSEELSNMIDNLSFREKKVSERSVINLNPSVVNFNSELQDSFSQKPLNYGNNQNDNILTKNFSGNLDQNFSILNVDQLFGFESNLKQPNFHPTFDQNNNVGIFNPYPQNQQVIKNYDKFQNEVMMQHRFLQNNSLYVPQQIPIQNTGIQHPQLRNYQPHVMNQQYIHMEYPQRIGNDEFYASKEIIENLEKKCKTYVGSKLIQDSYQRMNEVQKQMIFEKILDHIHDLSEDQYGNYVVQKVIEGLPELKLIQVYRKIAGQIYTLSIDMYGCRVLQKLIDCVDNTIILEMLRELKNDLKECILNKNGNHVVQKFVQKLPKGSYKDIIEVVVDNCYAISTSQFGCRVIQRIIESGKENEKDTIFEKVKAFIGNLMFDQFGNYVIQHFIEKRSSQESSDIYKATKGRVFEMCTHKFASNIIEKCLRNGDQNQTMDIINEVFLGEENNQLLLLINDRFGNYCVQKMIEHSSKQVQIAIIKKIASMDLRASDGYSKHIVDFIIKKGYPRPGTAEFMKIFK